MKKFFALLLIFFLGVYVPAYSKSKKSLINDTNKGYKGELPNLNRYFDYKKQDNDIRQDHNVKPINPNIEFQEAPFDDPIFMETIIKKEKNPPFVEDLLYIRPLLVKFQTFLETNPTTTLDIQKYVAQVNFLSLLSDDLIKKYSSTNFDDQRYIWVNSVIYRAKIVGNLLYDRKKYAQYMDITSGEYSKPYIDKEIKILMSELNKCIFKLMEIDVY